MQETSCWQVGQSREYAFFCDRMLDEWHLFTDWVADLPRRFTHLKKLAKTGRATDGMKLGRELIEAWTKHRSDNNHLRYMVAGLADGIAWRVVKWVRACDYQIKPDPAVLVLFED